MASQNSNPKTVQVLLDFDPRTGSLKIHGPIGNKMLMYGMLELAKDCVSKQADPARPPLIEVPQPGEQLPPPPGEGQA
jgi:hypothetical protein